MWTLIIGKKRIGKTDFIKNNLIPNLADPSDYLVFDVDFEYSSTPKKNRICFKTDIGLTAIKQQIKSTIGSADNNTTMILESVGRISNNLEWLEIAKEKNMVVVLQSVNGFYASRVPDLFDKIYLFPTIDQEEIADKFMREQVAKGRKFISLTPKESVNK